MAKRRSTVCGAPASRGGSSRRACRLPILVLLAVPLAGCASGELHSSTDAGGPDADLSTTVDAGHLDPPDASLHPVDASVMDAPPAPPDAAPPPPDAAPPPPDATPCTPVWQSLLANGNFDSGDVDWIEDSAPSPMIIAPGYLTPQSGSYVALVLGWGSDDETLRQTVTVPATATDLYLHGFFCFVTENVSTASDLVSIELHDGASTDTLASFDNLDPEVVPACNWVEFTYYAASAHAGRTIDLALVGQATSSQTSYHFDTLDLKVLACP